MKIKLGKRYKTSETRGIAICKCSNMAGEKLVGLVGCYRTGTKETVCVHKDEVKKIPGVNYD